MLALTQPLPALSNSGGTINDADPWAIQLTNEQRCALLTGMGNSAGGVTLSYGCGSDHSETSAVYHHGVSSDERTTVGLRELRQGMPRSWCAGSRAARRSTSPCRVGWPLAWCLRPPGPGSPGTALPTCSPERQTRTGRRIETWLISPWLSYD